LFAAAEIGQPRRLAALPPSGGRAIGHLKKTLTMPPTGPKVAAG
jgi:hypothetical protein